jgi:hypothetical protein
VRPIAPVRWEATDVHTVHVALTRENERRYAEARAERRGREAIRSRFWGYIGEGQAGSSR